MVAGGWYSGTLDLESLVIRGVASEISLSGFYSRRRSSHLKTNRAPHSVTRGITKITAAVPDGTDCRLLFEIPENFFHRFIDGRLQTFVDERHNRCLQRALLLFLLSLGVTHFTVTSLLMMTSSSSSRDSSRCSM